MQLLKEIVSNCSDEFLIGNCDEVTIIYDRTSNEIIIEDNGQGILPNVYKDDGRTVLEMVYGDVNTSGKYDRSDSSVYKISTGAFGIGASLTCFLSKSFSATTSRDGQTETVYFKDGEFQKRASMKGLPKKNHGVKVSFVPDEQFFQKKEINEQQLRHELLNLTCVCAGLKIKYNGEEFYHPLGLTDLFKDEDTITEPFSFHYEKDNKTIDFVMSFTTKSTSNYIPFCNYGLIESGTHLTAVKSIITRTLNKWGQANNLIGEKVNLSGNDLQEGILLSFNVASIDVRYDSQIKSRTTNTDDNSFINAAIGSHLEAWFDSHPDDGKTIIERAVLAKKASEAAKRARANVKAKATKNVKKKFLDMPSNLSDCWGKDRTKCELYIAEGLSAASGLVEARDSETVAILPVRGKMLSVLKTTPDKIVKNVEIHDLLTALGLDYNSNNGKCKYDPNKLRYGKIIAAADADPDGWAIENLLFNIIWYVCPELIQNGHVYSSIPPLFRITTKKNEYVYLKDEKALADFKKNNPDKKFEISRAKGLGEMDADELDYCLLNKKSRNIIQLTTSDIKQTDQMFQDLYGKKVEPRVKFLAEHLEEANID